MSNSIPLSPKHGLNPTIPVCAWCGKQKNEIALLGKIKTSKRGEDPEAPRYSVLDYEPCDECRSNWNLGVPVIEAQLTRPVPYRPPITHRDGEDIYPTGRFVVLKTESAERIFNAECKQGRPVLLEDVAFEQLFGGSINGNEQ